MTDESQRDQFATRRCVLLGAGVLGAAGLLTACSTAAVPYDANDAGQAPAAAGPPTTALDTASAAGSGGTDSGPTNSGATTGSASSAPTGTALGLAADVPVGGGKVYQTAQVVVTQPAKGQYKAFSCVCTHVGCLCNQVANGTIDCPCHGAKFKITDGSVVTGPATTPLAAASITVTDGKIFLN
jgi:nitrite reductase/ring-hydroxylating ferredoxin subunit